MKFNGWASEPKIIFCSENCYKKSFSCQETESKKQNNPHSKQTKSQSQTQTTQPETTENNQTTCPQCSKTLNPYTDYLNFCSEQCYLKHYGTLCPLCNKYDTSPIYWDKEKYPDLTYCLDCFEKELKRKNQKESELRKIEENKSRCQFCLVELNKFNQQSNLDYCLDCWEKSTRRIREGGKLESEQGVNLSSEVGSLKQEKVQVTDSLSSIGGFFEQALERVQTTYGVDSWQYKELKKEQEETISILKKASPTEQEQYLSLIKQLQPFLAKMPNLSESEQQRFISLTQEADESTERLKEKQIKAQQQEKTKLWIGVGCGVVGLGLVGLVVWLIRKKGVKE